jgi:hypothetical protein
MTPNHGDLTADHFRAEDLYGLWTNLLMSVTFAPEGTATIAMNGQRVTFTRASGRE